jgi:DtxR family Mn-dependent transcriptional regulator
LDMTGSERRRVPLTMMDDGQSGIVASIDQGGGRGFEVRLMDLGLTAGTKVIVVKSAPFHGPVEILVRGSRLALGRGIAERIFVEIEGK